MPSKASKTNPWNSDTVYDLGLCRMLAQILGIWPLSCQDIFSKIRISIVAVLEISMAINLIREIFADCVMVDEMVNFLALVACSMIAFLKVMVLRMNRTKMELIIKSAVDDWSKIKDSSAREIMKKHAQSGRFVFIFQMVSAFLTVIPLTLAPLPFLVALPADLEGHFENSSSPQNFSNLTSQLYEANDVALPRSLPMGTGCFVHDISSTFYALIYILQVIQLMTTCAGNVGTDVYFFSITMHVCGQFELLKIQFENFGESSDFFTCRQEIRALVKRHNHLIQLSNNFEDTFNILVLAQLSANALHMSLLGIQLLICMKTGNSVGTIPVLMAFYILSLQLFLYSYAGDYLMSQIEKIRYAAYCGCWYDLSPTIVKDLMFIMSRSNRAFNLTAGKVFCMNMDNFKNIFKAMGSYFSVLKIMFDA
uniref:Odorant receptor n=1 Tax=Campoletis chlorideae TaxID=219166 RepID=A0A346D3X1_9HYME|nr:odorant receptor [Campoletis chlorideae]